MLTHRTAEWKNCEPKTVSVTLCFMSIRRLWLRGMLHRRWSTWNEIRRAWTQLTGTDEGVATWTLTRNPASSSRLLQCLQPAQAPGTPASDSDPCVAPGHMQTLRSLHSRCGVSEKSFYLRYMFMKTYVADGVQFTKRGPIVCCNGPLHFLVQKIAL